MYKLYVSAYLEYIQDIAVTIKNNVILEKCILPLGMEEGKIPDEAITASSSYEMKSVGPQNARYKIYKDIGMLMIC